MKPVADKSPKLKQKAGAVSAVGPRSILRVRVSLQRLKPEIWRRLLVPGHVSLFFFHRILQIAMGWTDSHLHAFQIGGKTYGFPDPEWDAMTGDRWLDVEKFSLHKVVRAVPARFMYEYDMGDGWEHLIQIEKVVPRARGVRYPVCNQGARACPPEDCGGIYGYQEFLEAIKDPTHDQHRELLDWIGGPFDAEKFDLTQVNRELKSYKHLPAGYFEDL